MEASIIDLSQISKVEIIKQQPVYDIEIEENHNFYIKTNTDKILVHNSGKSDFVDMMCLGYNKQYGWKTAFASPENKPNVIHAGKLISKMAGKWIKNRNDFNTEWYQLGVDIIDYNYKFIDLDGAFDLEKVLEKTKSLIFKFGIKVLVIDPYNKVRLKSSANKNINEYTSDYLLMIDEFARKYDILIILVAHPRKPSMNETKTYEPTFYDIKGGGEFYDMSPHGLLVDRNYEHDLVKIKVLKVKFNHLGKNNEFIWSKWDCENGRYVNFNTQNEDPNMISDADYDDSNWLNPEEDKPIVNIANDFSNENNEFDTVLLPQNETTPF